ncbi:MAG: endonuclease/exonuclease/phosphatase family protein [Clostridia bacterium]|nr:endonuclease/exonuclease/phosphatase family protein [Clostridia bacterium]
MKRTVKIIFSSFGMLVLAAVLVLTGITFFHYPHYRREKQVVVPEKPADASIRVMSCNVRCLTPFDLGKRSWFYRANLIVNNIRSNAPTVIGFQEVTKWQYSYLTDTLPGFDSVITYRDKMFNSEGCPVFYRSDLYTLIDKNSFWLSETPDEMSKDWGAACYRICSYVILEEKTSGQRFVVFNTHLDHVSDEARINGINVVLDKIKAFGSLPAVIMGDFNAKEASETYKSATANFLDAKYQTENAVAGATYQNWGQKPDNENIDYFMISKKGFTVEEYKVISETYDGVYPSDHFPIFTVISLK